MAISCCIERRAELIGTAKPTPSALPESLRICALIPITRPRASKSGPPELPWLIGASVWIASTRLYCEVSESIERRIAETTPTPSEFSLPNGLPIAATGSPTVTAAELPSGTGSSEWSFGSTLSRPTSSKTSQPITFAAARSWSWNST